MSFDYLREQSIRMRRTKWLNPNPLAEELWVILQSIPITGTGPVSIDNSTDGTDKFELPPFEDLNFPTFDFQFPVFQEPNQFDNQEDFGSGTSSGDGGRTRSDQPQDTTIRNRRQVWVRDTIPGQVTNADEGSSSGGTLTAASNPDTDVTVNLLAYGLFTPDGQPEEQLEVTAHRLPDDTTQVRNDQWFAIYRISLYDVEEVTQIKDGNEVSRSTRVQLRKREHFLIPGGGSGGGRTAGGRIIGKSGHASGKFYNVEWFPNGFGEPGTQISAMQLQVVSQEVFPNNTWVMVSEVSPQIVDEGGQVTDEGEYHMQVPVWL